MGRGEFFKYVFQKTVSVVSNFTEDVLEPFRDAGEAAHKMLSIFLLSTDEYTNQPKLVTSVTPAIYLIGELHKNLTAFSAICSTDGFLLSHLPRENCFYCSACGSKHVLEFGENSVTTNLTVYPLAVNEDNIYIYK